MKKIAVCGKNIIIGLMLSYTSLSFATQLSCNSQDMQEMHSAIKSYIENDSKGASQGVSIQSDRCLSNYASAVVHYSQPEYDDQIAYLRHDKEGWTVLGVATGFDGDFMDSIPEPLQQ